VEFELFPHVMDGPFDFVEPVWYRSHIIEDINDVFEIVE